ncbi:hypothetical protein GGR58DRAFT_271487 [Xylaria digitata]|nr:hypothetical protein GGR58DRAFT_271487 [Xylaria digitata]
MGIGPCVHSDRKAVPVCWDCAEEGHLNTPSLSEGEGISPTWQKLRNFRRSIVFWDGKSRRSSISLIGTQSSTMELRPPEEGLEVAAFNQRRSQPGLIVVAGPHVVSPEDKFQNPEPNVGYSEPIQSHDFASKPEPIRRDVDPPPQESGSIQKDNPVSEPEKKIWGLRRRTFHFLVVIAVLALAGVIIGVAVAVTQHHMVRSTPLSASSDGKPTTTVSSSAPPPPKNTSPSSASPPSPLSSPLPTQSSPSSRICIGDDGSTYTDPGTGDKFRLECTVAHQGKDIVNLEANTMQSCISMCAKNTHCKGAIWYNVGPQGTDLNYCWLKSEMDDSDVRITADAQSVVRL